MKRQIRQIIIKSCASLLLAAILLCDPSLIALAETAEDVSAAFEEEVIADFTLEDVDNDGDEESAEGKPASDDDRKERLYDVLSDRERDIYDYLYDNADAFITHSYDNEQMIYNLYEGDGLPADGISESARDAFVDTAEAIKAFEADHPEIYWIDYGKFTFRISALCGDDGQDRVYNKMWLAFCRGDDDTFLYDDFSRETEEEARSAIGLYMEDATSSDTEGNIEDNLQSRSEGEDGIETGSEAEVEAAVTDEEEAYADTDDQLLSDEEEFQVVISDFATSSSKGIPAKNELSVGRGYDVDYRIVPASKADSVKVRVTSSHNSVASIGWDENNFNKVFPQKYGSVTLTVTATDKEDATKTASAQINVTCVYPTGVFFDFYGTKFAFSKSELFTEGWLTKDGGTFKRGRISGKNRKIYYFRDRTIFPSTAEDKAYPVIEEDGIRYIFDTETHELIKEWVKLTDISIADIPVEVTGIDTNALPDGSSYMLTAKLTPKNTNDSINPVWKLAEGSDEKAVNITPLGWKDDEVYARLDILKPNSSAKILVEAGEDINRQTAALQIYTRYPVGWHTEKGKSYYGKVVDASPKKTVERVTGEQTIDGRKYRFKTDKTMVTGIDDSSDPICDFGEDGALRATYEKRGFVPLPEGTVYYNDSHEKVMGFVEDDGRTYYTDTAHGHLQRGYFEDAGNNYYSLPEDDIKNNKKAGELQSGWIFADGAWRLFAGPEDTARYAELTYSSDNNWIQTRDLTTAPKRYYRKPGGKLLTGWKTIDGKKYYFDKDGSVLTGLRQISGKYYYFGETLDWDAALSKPGAGDNFGAMLTGRVSYDSGAHTNFFNGSGVRQTGWQKYNDGSDDRWDFFDVSTAESLGAVPVAGKAGWYEITRSGDTARYYFKDNNKLITGWQTLDNGKYWFDGSADANGVKGRMAVGITTIGSSRYYFREKNDGNYGVLLTGYTSAEDADGNSHRYFADSKGVLKLGWQKPDDVTYKFFDYKLGYELGNAHAEGDYWTVIEETVGGTTHYYKYYFKKGTNPATGLQEIGGNKYFFGNVKNSDSYGRLQSGLIKDGKTYYYSDPFVDTSQSAVEDPGAGQLRTGWIDGNYYANSKCALQKGWQTIDDRKYYFDPATLILLKGVQKIGKNMYVFDNTDGHMLTGYVTSGGAKYFTDKKGIVQYGWQNTGTEWHYFNTDPTSADYGKEAAHAVFADFGTQGVFYKAEGRIIYIKNNKQQKNTQKIDGRWYYFDSNGILQTGEFLSGKAVYRTYTETEAASTAPEDIKFTGSARTGIVSDTDGKRYYDSKGKRITGWTTIEKNTYYFDPETGLMKTGKFVVGKNIFYADAEGKRKTGFVDDASGRLYFNGKGIMLTGWQTIDKKRYYFEPSTGILQKGFQKIGQKMYYLDPADGHMLTGYINTGTDKYLTNRNGEIQTGWQIVDNGGVTDWKYFDTVNGKELDLAMTSKEINKVIWYTVGELPDGNRTVRAKFAFKNNKPLKGWQTIDGRKYFFDDKGRLATGFWIINRNRYYFSESTDIEDPILEGMLLTNGIKNVVGRYYYMQSSGACRTGWFKTSDGRYYGDPETGELAVGFKRIGDRIYFFSDQASTIGRLQTGFIKLAERGQTYYDDEVGASNMYYADADGVIVTSGWRNIKINPKVSDSQEWSYYFALNRPHTEIGDFVLTGELAVGDVLIDEDGNVSAYLDDGTGGNDGFASGPARLFDENGVGTDGTVGVGAISNYYRFNDKTGARRKEVLYFYGNYYGMPIDENQIATISSIRRYVDSGMEFEDESDDFIVVNEKTAKQVKDKDLTQYISSTFPMCASSRITDESWAYIAANDLNSDHHVDVLDTETYSKDLYDRAIVKYGPRNLVLAGASSGAGICLGLYKYAIGKNDPNKLPAKVLLLSPWIDVSMTNPKSRNLSKRQAGPTDVATLEYWGARYTRDGNYTDETGAKPYAAVASEEGVRYLFASPAGYDGSEMRNVIMYSGTYDPCYYDCEDFVNKANKAAGSSVMMLNKYSGGQHGFMFFAKDSAAKKAVLDFCRNIMTE